MTQKTLENSGVFCYGTMKKKIYCITDGKIGHVRQTEGLAMALQLFQDAEIHWISAFSLFDLLKNRDPIACPIDKNSIVIGAGHRTHFALLYYKIRFHAKAIVVMKPSFPRCWFDYCIIPQHDHIEENGNVLVTMGAMNGLSLKPAIKKDQLVILIGGPSDSCYWRNEAIYSQVNQKLLQMSDDKKVLLSSSRRTPEDFLVNLPSSIKDRVSIVDFKSISADWLPETLLESSEAWVTAESVSMMYESLSAGCQVQVLNVDYLSGKIAGNLQFLRDNGKVDQKTLAGSRLNESFRVAQKLINLGLFDEITINTN